MTDQQLMDNGICPTCRGKARYRESAIVAGVYKEWWVFCEDCEGTGYQKEEEYVD